MVSPAHQGQLEFALIDSDAKKADQLRMYVRSTVRYFPNVVSFLVFLASRTNAFEYLILIISKQLITNLSSDIQQEVRELYVYTEDHNNNDCQTFNDVCLHLCSLVIARSTMQSISSHLSNDVGLSKAYASQSIELGKLLIQNLQNLYDELDEQTQRGQEDTGG